MIRSMLLLIDLAPQSARAPDPSFDRQSDAGHSTGAGRTGSLRALADGLVARAILRPEKEQPPFDLPRPRDAAIADVGETGDPAARSGSTASFAASRGPNV